MIDFAIVGAAKSASTYVHHMLRAHPEICMPETETPFFERGYSDAEVNAELSGVCANVDIKVFGIKRPTLLTSHDMAVRLHDYNRDMKIIIVLRNPVARAMSNYYHFIRAGHLPCIDSEKGLRKLLAGEVDPRWPSADLTLEYGLYGKGLSSFLEFFPRENIKVIFDDDLKNDRNGTFSKLYQFIGCEDVSFVPPEPEVRHQKVIYSIPRLFVYRHLIQIDRKYYKKFARAPRPHEMRWYDRLLSRGILSFYQRVICKLFDDKSPEISPELREEIVAYYRADIEKLKAIIGDIPKSWTEFR